MSKLAHRYHSGVVKADGVGFAVSWSAGVAAVALGVGLYFTHGAVPVAQGRLAAFRSRPHGE